MSKLMVIMHYKGTVEEQHNKTQKRI